MAYDDSRGRTSLARFAVRRTVLVLVVVFLCATLAFGYVHFGPSPPAEEATVEGSELEDKKEAFGLYRPTSVQYVDYLTDMATFDFGEVWSSRFRTESIKQGPDDVNSLVEERGARTLWLWGWTFAVALAVGVPLGLLSAVRAIRNGGYGDDQSSGVGSSTRGGVLRTALVRAAPVVLLAPVLEHVLLRSRTVLFGFDWLGFGVETVTVTGPLALDDLAVATKVAIPPAIALSIPFVGTALAVSRAAMLGARSAGHVDAARGTGVRPRRLFHRHVLRNALLPVATTLRRNAAALVGATIVVETIFALDGAGRLFYLATTHGDYTTFQATLFCLFLFLGGVAVLQDVLVAWLGGGRTGNERRARACWTGPETGDRTGSRSTTEPEDRLRARHGRRDDDSPFDRIVANPRPVLVWLVAGGVLFALEAGAVLDAFGSLLQVPVPDLPTLLDRSHIPNEGYRVPGEGWQGTAFGLSPALALALRVGLVGAYALAWVIWAVAGWRIYRSVYRLVDRTPTDAVIRRFLEHRPAVVALFVVGSVVVAALFAPTIAATPVDRTVAHSDFQQLPLTEPNTSAQLTHYDDELGEVRTSSVGLANMRTKSDGTAESNVAPLSYDRYDRFHPLGTSWKGTDLYSELVVSARVYAIVGGIGAGLVATLAVGLVLLAARVRGRVERAIEALASATTGLPPLVVLFVVLHAVDRKAVTDATTTLVLIAVVLGVLAWPDLWKTLRAPAYRTLDAGWRDQCRLVGRRAVGASRGLTRLAGVVLAYTTTAFAGIVLTVTGFAALSPTIWTSTMAWGELYLYGIDQLTTVSGHTAVVPAVAVVVLVASTLVLADGIRAATATGQELGTSAPGEAVALGGGG